MKHECVFFFSAVWRREYPRNSAGVVFERKNVESYVKDTKTVACSRVSGEPAKEEEKEKKKLGPNYSSHFPGTRARHPCQDGPGPSPPLSFYLVLLGGSTNQLKWRQEDRLWQSLGHCRCKPSFLPSIARLWEENGLNGTISGVRNGQSIHAEPGRDALLHGGACRAGGIMPERAICRSILYYFP